jgi:hypothetical protein
MEEIKEIFKSDLTYETVGMSINPNEWVFSNSALNCIDPDTGGHPKKLYKFFTSPQETEDTSKSLVTGTLLHKYMQNPDEFAVSEIQKPSDKLSIAADNMIKELSSLESIESIEMNELLLANIREVGWNKNWKDEAIIKNTKDIVIPYVLESLRNKGKFILTSQQQKTLEGCIKSIQENYTIQSLVFSNNESTLSFTEAPVYSNYVLEDYIFKIKGKIDKIQIDYKAKIINIFDYKTTNSTIHKFYYSFLSYKYYRQMYFYKELIQSKFPDYKINIYLIVVETSNLFCSTVIRITDYWLDIGSKNTKDLFYRILGHIKNNNFNITMEEILNFGLVILPENYEPSPISKMMILI